MKEDSRFFERKKGSSLINSLAVARENSPVRTARFAKTSIFHRSLVSSFPGTVASAPQSLACSSVLPAFLASRLVRLPVKKPVSWISE